MSLLLKNCNVRFQCVVEKNWLTKTYPLIRKCLSSSASEDSKLTVENDLFIEENKENIEKLRDKSRLRLDHRNILFNKMPHGEPVRKHHLSVKYNRKLYGKYGSESGVNPGIMWPTKSDIRARKEYEQVAFPMTIQDMVAREENKLKYRENRKKEIHDKVVANLAKLQQWKQELQSKIAKKEAEALAAKEKKEKLIEEVRRHFGFTVNPKDDRFKEMLLLKEKEQKKKEKQARHEEREKKAISKLMAKHEIDLQKSKDS